MIQPANITVTPFLGSAASPYDVMVNITQRLCYPCCAANAPVFDPRFSLKSVTQVGDGLYMATIHVEGIISYVPLGGGCGCCRQQPLSQDFTIPVASATVPTITIAEEASVNSLAVTACQEASRTFVSETPLILTVA